MSCNLRIFLFRFKKPFMRKKILINKTKASLYTHKTMHYCVKKQKMVACKPKTKEKM